MRTYHRSGNEIKTDCPKCAGKMKLYINPVKRLFVCFKCGFKGRVTKELFNFIGDKPPERKEITPIPEGTMAVVTSPTAMKYLRSRNVEPHGEWLFCYDGKYADRILFPIYCFGKYWGFQARSVYPADVVPRRYMTSPGTPMSKVLYNYDMLPRETRKPVFVCEGVFGATMFENSVASFTKRLSTHQARMLATKAKTVVIAFDKDATKEAIMSGYTLYSFGVDVRVMLMKHKGPDDHTPEELKELSVVPLLEMTKMATKGYANV